jgi:hypothetical protein
VGGRFHCHDPGTLPEPPTPSRNRWTDQKHRPRGPFQGLLRDVAQQKVPEPSGAVAAKDDEVCLELIGMLREAMGHIRDARLVSVGIDPDSNLPEIRLDAGQVTPGLP